MNKLIKGAVTGAAGIALLLGGAGTFASWNAASHLTPTGTVNTGTLKISSSTPVGWFTDANATQAVDLNSFHAVPGDTLYYKTTADILAVGNHLEAEVGVDQSTLKAEFAAGGPTSTVQASVASVTGTGITQSNGDFVFTATGSDIQATVIVKVDFPLGDSSVNAGSDGQGSAIKLDPLTITLTQIPESK
jgi:alternate signal-mediated exported protein